MSSLLKRLVQLVLLVVAVLLIRHYVFSPAAVNGSSMEPTLHNNDRLWVTSIKKPQRFDIIAFPSPRNGQRLAKRLIGLPGETVEYRDDTLYINGVSLSEDYLASAKRNVSKNENYTQDFTLETLEATQSLTVPEGMYFVLGDNRPRSDDSRYFGFVKQASVEGVLTFRYYPLDKIGFP